MASNSIPLVLQVPALSFSPSLQGILNNYLDRLRIIQCPLDQLTEDTRLQVRGIFKAASIIIDAEFMDYFPNLLVISSGGVGVDGIDIEEASKRGIKVGNTPYVVDDCTADLAFALLLASARNVVQGDAISKSPSTTKFNGLWFGVKVSGATIGIVGIGNVGTAVAQRAKGFNMKILYYSRTRKEQLEKQIGVEYCDQLGNLLQRSDFVVLCVPLTPQTKHLIGARELSHMKQTATLVNVARGGVVNQDDLVKALQTGQIRAAALDVTSPEPLPRDHPLLTLPNVIITPHIGTATEATACAMVVTVMENLVAGLNGEPLPHSVN